MKTLSIVSTLIASAVLSTQAVADVKMNELMSLVQKGNISISAENKARETEFLSSKSSRERLLADIEAEKTVQEMKSDTLETAFEANEIAIDELKITMDKRLGSLKELFGVMQGATSDFHSALTFSLTNTEISGRQAFLEQLNDKMANSTQLPDISEIEQVWAMMQQEMIETGNVSRFTATVSSADGTPSEQDVVRIGAFNLISEGQYLQYSSVTGGLSVLPRQPDMTALENAQMVSNNTSGTHTFNFDPTGATGGSLLAALVDVPNLQERIDQGGTVGYIILAVGLIGLLVALERFFGLFWLQAKVAWQVKNKSTKLGMKNPLGRVLSVYNEHRAQDLEALELKVSEAIQAESPKITKRLGFIKLIAMVAPLMGLLGTVTGMIITFQQISLFGAGDPKTMAGGISAALMTTVFGLVVAIPMLLLHTLLHTKARGIVNVIEEQATGLMAESAEARIGKAGAETMKQDEVTKGAA